MRRAWLFSSLLILLASSCLDFDPVESEFCDSGSSPACPERCANGRDDDADQLADCADPDCRATECFCVFESPGTPCGDGGICGPNHTCVDAGTEVICNNSADDDNDGDPDCQDPDCLDAPCATTNMCVVSPRCQANGTCGGVFKVCTTTNACYTNPGACVPPGGTCSHAPAPGNACDDGNPCTETDRCDLDGGCASSPPCSRPPACYTAAGATCTGAGCTYLRLDGGCNDNNACTFNDQCDEDAGCAGTAYTCPPPSTECMINPCDGDGGCGPQFPLTGRPCDGGVCTASGSCSGFPYIPSNFDPSAVAVNGIGGNPTFGCQNAWFNSTDGGAYWCGGQPPPVVTVITQDTGVEAVVLAWSGLTITGAARLTLVGSRPVIIAVYGDADVRGYIGARSANGIDAGAGSDPAGLCNAADGGVEPGSGGAGGGGGGYGFIGADGGTVTQTLGFGGVGGRANGNAAIDPLRGGCSGGTGGRTWDATALGSRGGAGGGAVQISAAGLLSVSGTVTASGAGGLGGRSQPSMPGNGGGGGGSGGAVLLEGLDIDIQNGTWLTANGGGGGGAGNTGSASGTNGVDGSPTGSNRAAGGSSQNCSGVAPAGGLGGAGQGPATAGGNGVLSCGAAGGGGAIGRIRVNGFRSCFVSGSAQLSPPPSYGGDAGVCP